MTYPILEKLNSPADLRLLDSHQLEELAAELRRFIQEQTRTKAGHIRSSLGVVELSIALHYHFKTPDDILIWDVGHQAYAHKVLCERRSIFQSNRQKGGISGFTKRSESAYDPFGAGHSSTSISALAGFVKAAQLEANPRKHVAVIGDGALTGGQAFEALNYLGDLAADCLVILNDNKGSIDPNVGALQKLNSYQGWAESLGFQYHTCEKGNSIADLLAKLKELNSLSGPLFLHIQTEKGLGYNEVIERRGSPAAPSFQSVFGETILKLLETDPKLVVLSPAMLSGAQLLEAQKAFPERVIDVGIAEQNVVTMAAGLAASGFKPLVHLYSTFAQRALDQIIHDVALQQLPVVFVFDRAGFVGEDGPTHHGVFDQALLADVPNMRLMAPAGGRALKAMLEEAMQAEGPMVIRYPKASFDLQTDSLWQGMQAHWWRQSTQNSAILSYGSQATLAQAAAAAKDWSHLHIPQFRPLDQLHLVELLASYRHLILVDENPAGGSLHRDLLALLQSGKLKAEYQAVLIDKAFSEHAPRAEQLAVSGFSLEKLLERMFFGE
ncbi:1-deoxy-D-xylulose-5-phosphate synthase [Croceimicrobium hydrocarbonivorans]|uniref:1-deoxy-D-xylulose-5-phosphate synthase n=1 Tax=Croceimicrobium hydrocarbonivorans TaxID=2761580 RepID=A0A7H0VJ35_9FLAO|nr:1-deoxy-D-xylulose-5-phosphate synthase [Croceimicrobium hydrocarbonivorans]QNR25733.1 1-deoxy-D-xylulose-5-phosphate synthase [Croceimicrobium hydrocarbonivorans]